MSDEHRRTVDDGDSEVVVEDFGPYIVYELLGQGGMATVHRAEKRGVGIRRPVALKRLLAHAEDEDEMVKLFIDEARLASHLHHANVAQTYELGKVGDTFFIAMEYASGPTLSQVIRHSAAIGAEIPIPVTVAILSQVCDALDYAHNLCDESGEPLRIIHRDVSPGNIIVSDAGVVKLIDFGIAKATTSSVKTQAGYIKGKFGYIAPEYILGQIDARVDLFAVGVIAHEMLTGRRLFEGKDDFETLSNVRDMVMRPPSQWNPEVPRDLDSIVLTALSRDPNKRWQTAGAMQAALANVARQLGVIVGGPQLVEWVDWAFGHQAPDSAQSLPMMRGSNDTDQLPFVPGVSRESSLSIQLGIAASEIGRARASVDPLRVGDDTAPIEHILGALDDRLTPPPEIVPRGPRRSPTRTAASQDGVEPAAGWPKSSVTGNPSAAATVAWPASHEAANPAAAAATVSWAADSESPHEPAAPGATLQWTSDAAPAAGWTAQEPRSPSMTAPWGARRRDAEPLLAGPWTGGQAGAASPAVAAARWLSQHEETAEPPSHASASQWLAHGPEAAPPSGAPMFLSPSEELPTALDAVPVAPMFLSPSSDALERSRGDAAPGAYPPATPVSRPLAQATPVSYPLVQATPVSYPLAQTTPVSYPQATPVSYPQSTTPPPPPRRTSRPQPAQPGPDNPAPSQVPPRSSPAVLNPQESDGELILPAPAQPARSVKQTSKVEARGQVARPPAPERRRVLWLVLLMVGLGIAAMATAYFWPSGL